MMIDEEIDQLIERTNHRASQCALHTKEANVYLHVCMQLLGEIAKRMPDRYLTKDDIEEGVWSAMNPR